MSFLSDIADVGSGIKDFLSGNSIASSLVKIIGITLIANEINKNINPSNDTPPAPNAGSKIQMAPATDNKIPVLYGAAFFSGIITDAVMSSDRQTMTYCLTLSERTGTKLSDGQASTYAFHDVYWNDQRIVFNPDGITASYTVDASGNVDRSVDSRVKVWCYSGNSSAPVIPTGYTNTSTSNAYTVMPGWNSTDNTMNELIFAIVQVTYNQSAGITSLGSFKFHVENSMSLPGDCLNDYMTNTRYGAGINPAEVYSA